MLLTGRTPPLHPEHGCTNRCVAIQDVGADRQEFRLGFSTSLLLAKGHIALSFPSDELLSGQAPREYDSAGAAVYLVAGADSRASERTCAQPTAGQPTGSRASLTQTRAYSSTHSRQKLCSHAASSRRLRSSLSLTRIVCVNLAPGAFVPPLKAQRSPSRDRSPAVGSRALLLRTSPRTAIRWRPGGVLPAHLYAPRPSCV